MSKSVNIFLLNENFVTYGTVLTLGKTGLGTGRSLCLVNNLGVTKSLTLGSATYGTSLSNGTSSVSPLVTKSFYLIISICVRAYGTGVCSISFICTGGIGYNSSVLMSDCGNVLLFNGYSTADRTLLTLGKTGFGTGRTYCWNNLGSMSELGNVLLLLNDLSTISALNAGGKALIGTGRILALKNCGVIMLTGEVTHFAADVTILILVVVILMSLSGNYILRLNDKVTNGTLDSLCQAVLGTGYFLAGKGLGSMTESIYGLSCSGKLFITYRAVNYAVVATVLGAGGSNLVFLNRVSLNVAFGVDNDVHAVCDLLKLLIEPAAATVFTNVVLNVTVFITGSRLSLYVNGLMSSILVGEVAAIHTLSIALEEIFVRKLSSLLGLGVCCVATVTLCGHSTVSFTGSILVGNVIYEAVSESGSKLCVTHGTKLSLGTGCSRAGSMSESFAFGLVTSRAGLGVSAIRIYPRVSVGFTLCGAADQADSGVFTSSILPGVNAKNCSNVNVCICGNLVHLDCVDLAAIRNFYADNVAGAELEGVLKSYLDVKDSILAVFYGELVTEE